MSRIVSALGLLALALTMMKIERHLARLVHEQTFANCMAMAERGVLCDAARDARRPAKASRSGALI